MTVTVLVFDPHRELADMAAEVLTGQGFTALVARTVPQLSAVLLAHTSIEVFICHAAPAATGRADLLRGALRVIESRVDAGLVVISSAPFEDLESVPRSAVHLQKPFGAAELLRAVDQARQGIGALIVAP